MITIAYFTCRKNPCISWFFDAIHNQCGGDYSWFKIVVIDFYADEPGRRDEFQELAHCAITHVTPKSTVWQGKDRLTSRNYFAASNARNTAICLAEDGHLVCVDDCSLPMPGWLDAVKEAAEFNGLTCGRYRKVYEMKVAQGYLSAWREGDGGKDNREKSYGIAGPVASWPGHLYGCSFAAPVEVFLTINGFPEACDSMSYEDSITGLVIGNNGYPTRYDGRMYTIESEEHHWLEETPFVRWDPGQSPNDKSHKMLAMFKNAKRFDNYFGEEGIRGLRARILRGEPFPKMEHPCHEWFTGKLLREL